MNVGYIMGIHHMEMFVILMTIRIWKLSRICHYDTNLVLMFVHRYMYWNINQHNYSMKTYRI